MTDFFLKDFKDIKDYSMILKRNLFFKNLHISTIILIF